LYFQIKILLLNTFTTLLLISTIPNEVLLTTSITEATASTETATSTTETTTPTVTVINQLVPITTKIVSSNPTDGEVYSMQIYVKKFVSISVCGFLWDLWFPPPIKLTATI
jgi:hypothetical protein